MAVNQAATLVLDSIFGRQRSALYAIRTLILSAFILSEPVLSAIEGVEVVEGTQYASRNTQYEIRASAIWYLPPATQPVRTFALTHFRSFALRNESFGLMLLAVSAKGQYLFSITKIGGQRIAIREAKAYSYTSHKPRFTRYASRTTSHGPRITNHKHPASSIRPSVKNQEICRKSAICH